MAPSVIEKYEQILAADPRSRIFVELARALLDRGDARRAMEICRTGLEHHPRSIQGRVTWGRALLATGDARGAHDQFDVAIGIDPGTPYAYNLVGDALVAAGLFREALPVLARAVELQPADAPARIRLEEARRRASGGTATALPAATAPPDPDLWSGPVTDRTGPTRSALPAVAAPPEAPPTPIGLQGQGAEGPTEELTLRMALDEPLDQAGGEGLPALPPRLPSSRPGGLPGPRTLLGILPPGAPPAPEPPPGAAHDPAEASRVAAAYEQELRARATHAEAQAAAPSRRRRVVTLLALAVVLAGAAGTFAWFRAQARAEALERSLREARVGLARDTRGALAKAAEVLARARADTPGDPRLLSLLAQVNAVLAADHGDPSARALALALALTDPAVAGDGALAARWLLAADAAGRAEATRALLSPPAGATLEPILHRLAGMALLAKGELDAGRARLEKAASATPPDLAALAALGDGAQKAGDPERALAYYEAAIHAQATHPRSVIGAAEARLALSRPLDGTLRELAAVEADPTSPPPAAERLRFELAWARALAASGDVSGAVRRLTLAAGALGDSSRLAATRAELLLGARRWEEAEAAAATAVRLEPAVVEHQLLLARARNGAHHHAAALQALEGRDGRAVWLERGIALHGLGRQDQARAALERTLRSGKMPGDAAVWYARADVARGRADRALPLLTRLAAAQGVAALVQASLGEALLAARRPAEAEAACRAAIARDASAPEGHRCLGLVLLRGGRAGEAIAPLTEAVTLDPGDPEARRLLAAASVPARATPPRKPRK